MISARALSRRIPMWSISTSASCFSMVCSGLSDTIGSWKIIEIWLPRTLRSSASDACNSELPLNRISPPGYTTGGEGNSRSTERAVTLLPEPDSPTNASVSPCSTCNETPLTT
ncbi:hypothetical protein D3C81_2001010 [compost metagenome]